MKSEQWRIKNGRSERGHEAMIEWDGTKWNRTGTARRYQMNKWNCNSIGKESASRASPLHWFSLRCAELNWTQLPRKLNFHRNLFRPKQLCDVWWNCARSTSNDNRVNLNSLEFPRINVTCLCVCVWTPMNPYDSHVDACVICLTHHSNTNGARYAASSNWNFSNK